MFSNKQISSSSTNPAVTSRRARRLLPLPLRRRSPTGTRTGYTNLVQHVVSQHPDHQATMQAASPGETGTLASCVRQRSINLFGWMEWILKNNIHLNFCESEKARRYTKLDPICVQTLCRSLHKVARAVEAKLAAEMPDQFGLIIDGWTHASEHYLAVFGCYMVGAPTGAAGWMCEPSVEPGHGELLEESSQDLGSVQALMIKLRSLNQAAKLRLKTSLRPVIRQKTRWSSTFMMLDRYFKLLDLPRSRWGRALVFDGLITLRASLLSICERAEIVYAADFEAACLKIQEGRAHQLSRAQKAAVSQLAVREAPATGAASDGAQTAAKRRKTTGSSGDEEESFVEHLKGAPLGLTLYLSFEQ
ncbi:hypothetical protein GQ600_11969 [Phytophthora cactorum]|nr:hypothetical protein GQ600_11969 [Phytophthora cactorum]